MFSFFWIILFSIDGFASGNYRKKTYSSPPASSRSSIPSSATAPKRSSTSDRGYVIGPQVRDAKTIEKNILDWERPGVAIHAVTGNADKFFVRGAYSRKSNFERFLKKLKGEDEGTSREVVVKESSSSFGGSTTYTFEAEVENAW